MKQVQGAKCLSLWSLPLGVIVNGTSKYVIYKHTCLYISLIPDEEHCAVYRLLFPHVQLFAKQRFSDD